MQHLAGPIDIRYRLLVFDTAMLPRGLSVTEADMIASFTRHHSAAPLVPRRPDGMSAHVQSSVFCAHVTV